MQLLHKCLLFNDWLITNSSENFRAVQNFRQVHRLQGKCGLTALACSTAHLLLVKAFFGIFFLDPITSQDLTLMLKLDISEIVMVDERV